MKNQFAKIFTYKGNQVVLMKTSEKALKILCKPDESLHIDLDLVYESSSVRDIMFETLNAKAIESLIINDIAHE